MYYTPEQQIPGLNLDHHTTSTIHNRFNFMWYTSNEITVVAEMRNRILFGSLIQKFPTYQSIVDVDKGYFDLSFVPIDGIG